MNQTKNLFEKYQIQPSKRLGQNFLINKGVIEEIIKAAGLSPNDVVLEIGPGIGNLTTELAKKAKKVIAVEKDREMIKILEETLKGFNNIEVVQGDILKFQIPKGCKIVANLPFYLTARAIRKFLEAKNPPEEITLVVQKEVAQRICAKVPDMIRSAGSGRSGRSGSEEPSGSMNSDEFSDSKRSSRAHRGMNLLAVSVQFYAKPKIINYISKTSFWPAPRVDSAILRITPLVPAGRKLINTDLFFKIIKAGFSHPRKQLINNLSLGLKLNRAETRDWLSENKILSSQRAETLRLEDWINLAKTIK